MSYYDSARKILTEILTAKNALPELYSFLPRDDYYRMKQLLEEMEAILKKHQSAT